MKTIGEWVKIEFRLEDGLPIPIIPEALFGEGIVCGCMETMVDEETGDVLMRAVNPYEWSEESGRHRKSVVTPFHVSPPPVE